MATTVIKNVRVFNGESLTELELMVSAGMTPVEVLKSMGEPPAKYFPFLADRGTIEVGKRADLVLVEGDPTQNISACRNIKKVWVKGRSSECHCACTNG